MVLHNRTSSANALEKINDVKRSVRLPEYLLSSFKHGWWIRRAKWLHDAASAQHVCRCTKRTHRFLQLVCHRIHLIGSDRAMHGND